MKKDHINSFGTYILDTTKPAVAFLWATVKPWVFGWMIGRVWSLGVENDELAARIRALEATTCEQPAEPVPDAAP